MEYLMTYAWAILVIAIVLVSVYQLGLFSTSSPAVATPGSCQVSRPGGPLSTFQMRLIGICNGALPQYVASFSPTSTSSIGTGATVQPSSMPTTTWIAWVYPTSLNYGVWQQILSSDPGGWGRLVSITAGSNTYTVGVGSQWNTGIVAQGNAWQMITVVWTASNVYFYLNGVQYAYGSAPGNPSSELKFGIGNDPPPMPDGNQAFIGRISNVQVYNTSLSANDIQALYKEGIGGAPLVLQNLVGWWPLNGNANDYSGNNFTGTATGVSYTSAWTGSYTSP